MIRVVGVETNGCVGSSGFEVICKLGKHYLVVGEISELFEYVDLAVTTVFNDMNEILCFDDQADAIRKK